MGSEEFEPEQLIQNKNYDFIKSMEERHFDAHHGNWQEFLRQKIKDWRTFPQLTDNKSNSKFQLCCCA